MSRFSLLPQVLAAPLVAGSLFFLPAAVAKDNGKEPPWYETTIFAAAIGAVTGAGVVAAIGFRLGFLNFKSLPSDIKKIGDETIKQIDSKAKVTKEELEKLASSSCEMKRRLDSVINTCNDVRSKTNDIYSLNNRIDSNMNANYTTIRSEMNNLNNNISCLSHKIDSCKKNCNCHGDKTDIIASINVLSDRIKDFESIKDLTDRQIKLVDAQMKLIEKQLNQQG